MREREGERGRSETALQEAEGAEEAPAEGGKEGE